MTAFHRELIDVDDSLLIIIDIQDYFLRKLEPARAEFLLSRAGWLMDIARSLRVPMVVTAEEADRLGSLSPALASKLPPGTPAYNKMVFGLAGQPDILQAVEKTGRRTTVLVGLETDVCVAQSAIGLLQNGYNVVAISDVTDSPGTAHEAGLTRMREARVLVTTLKVLYYEWIRTVELSNTLAREHESRSGSPLGIIL